MWLEDCTALITGASAGIGREFACQLADRAAILLLVARREERLHELRDELQAHHPKLQIEIHRTDLARRDEVESLLGWIERQGFHPDLLINNAGLGDLGAFASSDPEKVEQILQVNVVALTRLTRALLPQMIARGRGAILNVSSSASFLPIPNFAVYAATKAYVTSFSEALRGELHGSGIHVSALCPGPVKTEFTSVARRKESISILNEPEIACVPVEQVVADALHAIERNKAIVIPGMLMKLGMFLVRLTPLPLLRAANRLFAKRA
jgi:short-subunit dehydrogenase